MQGLHIWHEVLASRNIERLDELLAPDCVFISPVVHTPQAGRDLTKLYLAAAFHVLAGDSFHYVKEIVDAPHAVLEFETEVDGIVINGIDMITFNDDNQIVEFKVMIRPLKAINLLHAKMREMLEQLAESAV